MHLYDSHSIRLNVLHSSELARILFYEYSCGPDNLRQIRIGSMRTSYKISIYNRFENDTS